MPRDPVHDARSGARRSTAKGHDFRPADFYQRAAAASKIAFEASRARRADDFKARIVDLRAACNSCHAAYQKVD
jgi:cytochrome c556